jgi:hypothetical protein
VAEPCSKAALEALAKPALRAAGVIALTVAVSAAREDGEAGEIFDLNLDQVRT